MYNLADKYLRFIERYNMVGANLVLIDKNRNIECIPSGYQSIENNVITKTSAIYRIASISKVIVAICIMQLYDEGLVDLDEDISKYLGFDLRNPGFPNDKITLRMIMTQTSSITDNGSSDNGIYKGYEGANSTNDYIPLRNLFINDNKNYTRRTFSKYKPGTHFEYSNLGCGILACVVEHVKNVRFTDYVKDNLLLKLDIYSGFRLGDLKYKENLASHYQYDEDRNKFVLYRDFEKFKRVQSPKYELGDNYRGVAGGLYITASDLSKICIMLMNKGVYKKVRILSEKAVYEMEKVQWSGKSEDPTYYKKGLQMIILDQFTNKPLHGHFGNAYGLRSFMLYNDDGGMIFLCNGANFLSDEEHMTKLQQGLITFLADEMNI